MNILAVDCTQYAARVAYKKSTFRKGKEMRKHGWIVFLAVMVEVIAMASLAACSKGRDYAAMESKFFSVNDADQKVGILTELINSNNPDGHCSFYNILSKAPNAELAYFRIALQKSGTTELLLNLGHYLDKMHPDINANTKGHAGDDLIVQKAERIFQNLFVNLDKLTAEIGNIARKNPEALAAAVKKAFIEKKDKTGLAVAGFGLMAMKEDGASALLKHLGSDNDSMHALAFFIEAFGPYMVAPIFKQYENPASTADQKKVAGIAIYMLPDNDKIFEKVLEAYCHGRYFGIKTGPDGKMSVKDAFENVLTWWGNQIKNKYKNNEQFIAYAATKYPVDSEKHTAVIDLMTATNFGLAAPYLGRLDFARIPEKSLDVILNAVYIQSDKQEYLHEKFEIFQKIFKKLDAKKREAKKTILQLSGYPPDYKVEFVRQNIGLMTEQEKETAVYFGSEQNFPRDKSNEILNMLQKNASPKVMQAIRFARSKNP
jgi:hypothetical protein